MPTSLPADRRGILVALAFASLIALGTQCDAPVVFGISGDRLTGVNFRIFDATSKNRAILVNKIEVRDSEENTLWRIVGKGELREFVYGAGLDGFDVAIGPDPLLEATRYHVTVVGMAGRRFAYGDCWFSIDATNVVRPEEGCDRDR